MNRVLVTRDHLDMLTHQASEEKEWINNVSDFVHTSNDNFKPCIATLKFDRNVNPFIYDLRDNIPPFNYMYNNNYIAVTPLGRLHCYNHLIL